MAEFRRRNPPGGNGRASRQLTALSAVTQRAGLAAALGKQFGGDRDLYSSLGYKPHLRYEDYYNLYDRQDIASRIVNMPASSTWRNTPTIVEDNDQEEATPFEDAWQVLVNRLQLWHYLERVDRLAGIGHYAVLMIGVVGGDSPETPLEPGTLSGPEDVLYLSPFSEKSAVIQSWVTDAGDPRFGKPLTYTVDVAGDTQGFNLGGSKITVHYTRLLHVAEELLEDEVYGKPRLRRVFNLMYDLQKVVGGSAEMFWQGAFQGLHANVQPDIDFDPNGPEATQMSEEIDEYIHGLRRYIRTRGIDITSLGGNTPNPEGIFEVIMSLVAGTTGIPKRILLGAERGELASSQDEINFNAYISGRQQHFAEPLVLRPLIDRFIQIGALPEPVEGYDVEWPNLFELDEKEKSEIADRKAGTIQKYVSNLVAEDVMPIPEFRREVLGLEGNPAEEDLTYTEQRMKADFSPDDGPPEEEEPEEPEQ